MGPGTERPRLRPMAMAISEARTGCIPTKETTRYMVVFYSKSGDGPLNFSRTSL